jgi:hypothetical protein
MVMASWDVMPESPLDVLSRAATMVESGHNSSMEMETNHNSSSDSDIAQPDSPPQVRQPANHIRR